MAKDLKNTFTPLDAKFMARALKLAENGTYSTTPNPNVGCVIVDGNNKIVGEGFHQTAGQPHAEVFALRQAADKARNAIAYVTLEPCSHTNRTPPCALALIKAGVKKVVISATDPNPKVSGGGINLLKNAGIEVETGLLAAVAEAQNKFFFHRMRTNRPFVTVKLASSLDGKTALSNGKSKWITSPQARADVQKMRATACAILTGADTVIADDPNMTLRANELPEKISKQLEFRARPLLRAIVDGKNRLHQDKYKIFDQCIAPSIVYNLTHNPSISEQMQVQIADSKNSFVCLKSLLSHLATIKEVNHLWVEAGQSLCGALIERNMVDRLVLYQAPVILGDKAKGLFNTAELLDLKSVRRLTLREHTRLGPDIKMMYTFS